MGGLDWSHARVLAAERSSPSKARDFVRLHLGEHDLARLVDDVRLVVSELASNAVQHAQTPFIVSMCGDGCTVLLTVQDDSPEDPVRLSPGDTGTGGRGIAIVDRLSHDWGVDRGLGTEKSVWASFLMS